MILSNFCSTGQTPTETLIALCGPDAIYAAQLILIASLWRNDLSGLDKTKLRAHHFTNEKLRTLAEFTIGSTATFGLNDSETTRRLLITHCSISERWVDITFRTIEQVAELLIESDVAEAWRVVNSAAKVKAVA